MKNSMPRRHWIVFLIAWAGFSAGCQQESQTASDLPENATWEEVEQAARGTKLYMSMWDGDPLINAYMRDYVAVELKSQFDIELKTIGGQGNQLVSKLIVDLESNRQSGDIDVMWINGETFYQLREIDGLYGPFVDRLPNSELIDWENPFIKFDFQQPIEGYECPWGNVQLALIYNSEAVPVPPKNRASLAEWIRSHPGRFTFDNSFTGMTFLKSLLYEFAGGPDSLHGEFNEELYLQSSEKLWSWLRELRPYLWRQGETYPEGVAQLHQLFSNNEVDFTMSNNDGEVDNKVSQGILPETAVAYVLDSGTIRNSHYLGIAVNSPNKAAAMVLINFLISPEAQLKKSDPSNWGDGTVLSLDKLSEEWKQRFATIPGRTRVPPRAELEPHALMEPVPELMIRLHNDFRRKIIEMKD